MIEWNGMEWNGMEWNGGSDTKSVDKKEGQIKLESMNNGT